MVFSWTRPVDVSAAGIFALTFDGPGCFYGDFDNFAGRSGGLDGWVNWVFWGGRGSGVGWVGGVGVLSAIGFGVARNGENDVVLSVEFALFFGELASGGV